MLSYQKLDVYQCSTKAICIYVHEHVRANVALAVRVLVDVVGSFIAEENRYALKSRVSDPRTPLSAAATIMGRAMTTPPLIRDRHDSLRAAFIREPGSPGTEENLTGAARYLFH